MEEEESIAFGSQLDEEWRGGGGGGGGGGEESDRSRRATCWDGCGRPSNACICCHLPPDPIPTTTQTLILHHPHELRHKLSTVPVLARCLDNCVTIPGRRLRLGSSPLLDSLYHLRAATATKALFLFPSTDPSSPSIDLAQWAASSESDLTRGVVLIVFDGTWKHAKEMVTASLPFLSLFARCVSLGECDVRVDGESIYESELVLRKEPFRGCLSTMEAVARSLSILEPDGRGVEIEARLLDVLRAMVRLQALHLKPMKPRPRLMRNNKPNKGTKKTKTEEEIPSYSSKEP